MCPPGKMLEGYLGELQTQSLHLPERPCPSSSSQPLQPALALLTFNAGYFPSIALITFLPWHQGLPKALSHQCFISLLKTSFFCVCYLNSWYILAIPKGKPPAPSYQAPHLVAIKLVTRCQSTSHAEQLLLLQPGLALDLPQCRGARAAQWRGNSVGREAQTPPCPHGTVPCLLCPTSFNLNLMLFFPFLNYFHEIVAPMHPCNLIRTQFLSPSLQAALFLLPLLFKADLAAMTSILLADGAPTMLVPPICNLETCPGTPPQNRHLKSTMTHSARELLQTPRSRDCQAGSRQEHSQ